MGAVNFSFPVSHEPLDECSIGKRECEIALWVWPIVSASIWLFIYLPLVLHHGNEYSKHSHHIVYTNRYSDIVMLQIKTFIIHLFLSLNNIFAVWYVDQVQPLYIIYLSLETSVSIYLYYLFVWRFYLLYYDIRFIEESKNNQWIAVINPILFKRKSSHISDITETDKQFDYYLLNRNSLGNKKFLYKHVIIPTVIISALIFTFTELITSFSYQEEAGKFGNDSAFAKSYSIVLTLKLIPFIILFIIYYKMPRFEDEFYVILELQRLFLCLFCCIICIYASTLMQIWTQENLLWNAIIGPCVTYNTIIFWHTLIAYICTGWVNKRVKKIIISEKYSIKNVTSNDFNIQYLQYDSYHHASDLEDSVQKNINANLFNIHKSRSEKKTSLSLQKVEETWINKVEEEERNNENKEIKLLEIIAHEKAFTSFMSHLASEFSMEILLSIYEFIQYKNLVKQYMNKHNIIENDNNNNEINEMDIGVSIHSLIDTTITKDNTSNDIKLPQIYPKSYIVWEYDNGNVNVNADEDINILELPLDKFIIHCKNVIIKLYRKYVAAGSSWEINLSFYVRRKVEKIVGNSFEFLQNDTIGLKELFYIFDECIRGVFNVMTDSYDRFKRTHQYRKLKNLMFIQN